MILLIGQSGTGLTFLTWSLQYLRLRCSHRPDLYEPCADGSFHNFLKEKHYRGALPPANEFAPEDVVFWNPNHQRYLDQKPRGVSALMVSVTRPETKRWLFNRNWRCVPNWTVKKLHQDLCQHHNKINVDRAFSRYWTKYTDYIDYDRYYTNIKTIDLDEIFRTLHNHIEQLCEYFNLGFDHERFHSWVKTYHQWRHINLNLPEEKEVTDIMSSDSILTDEAKQVLKKLILHDT
jgi:hypothetical protein